MVNREVRKELLKKLKITRQALSNKAKRLKAKYGPMTTDEAVYIIAHQENIDLGKYLPLDVLDRIRSLIPKEVVSQQLVSSAGKGTKKGNPPRSPAYPLVKNTVINKAVSLGKETFPQVVVLENSIRNVIQQVLAKSGRDWWPALIPQPVLNNVQRTMKKEKNFPYRERRGNHPLLYCNFDDLRQIIVANDTLFSSIILDFEWFNSKMIEVYMARNGLAHSVIISKDDISRIALFYRDWARMLESANVK